MTAGASLRADLDEALRSHDRPQAVRRAVRAIDDGEVAIPDLYDVLAEILIEVGARWQKGAAEVWQEHLVTSSVRTIVEHLALHVADAAPDPGDATVVLAAPDDEYHDLGLRMLADRFALAGWRTHFLGADVPVAELSAAARSLEADAVVLSASTHFHRLRLRAYVETLAATMPDVTVWVGGPAFAHGHEGWADEMVLTPRSIPPPGGPHSC
jgi:MerR family transcriptional regulator, light-induced transcriptional regulator